MTRSTTFARQAAFLREVTGSTALEQTLLKALKVFTRFDIPHYVCGGFAVQERGYPRFTADVDVIVPDVTFSIEKLSLNGFKANAGSTALTDRATNVEVHVLPGGKQVDSGPVGLPMPTRVSDTPQIVTLETLISLKLSRYLGSGIARVKDYADVVELMKRNRLSRGFAVDPKVRAKYHEMWDALHVC